MKKGQRQHRKQYSGTEKVSILRRHLVDKIPVSDLCEELGLQPDNVRYFSHIGL